MHLEILGQKWSHSRLCVKNWRLSESESLRIDGVLAVCVLALLLVFEVQLNVALITTAFTGVQWIVGGRFVQRALPNLPLSPMVGRVLGLMLVYSFVTVGHFVGWVVVGSATAWLTVSVVLGTILGLLAISHSLPHRHQFARSGTGSDRDILLLVLGSLGFLLNDFGWVTPLVVVVALLVLWPASWRLQSRPVRMTLTVTALSLGTALSLSLRSNLWWFLTDDYWMFDALISSLRSVGPFAQYSTLGDLTWQYHIASYQYAAIIEQVSNAESLIVLSRVLPVIAALFASGATLAFLSRYTKLGCHGKALWLFGFAVTYRYTFQSPSYAVGFGLLISALYFWANRRHVTRLHNWILLIPSSISAAIATKFSNLYVLTALIGASAFSELLKGKPLLRFQKILPAILGLGLLCVALGSFASPRLRAELSSYEINGFGREFLGDYGAIGSRVTRHYALASILLSLVAPAVIALLVLRRHERPDLGELMFAGYSGVVLALIFGLLGGNLAGRYFVESALTVATLVAVIVASSSPFPLNTARILLLSLCAFFGIATVVSRPLINGPEEWETVLRAMVVNGSGLVAAPLLLFGLISVRVKTGRMRMMLVLALLSVLTINISADVAGLRDRESGDPLGDSVAEQNVARGSVVERTAAQWLRQNSSPSAVVASNYFCDECIGETWIDEDIDRFSRGLHPLQYEWGGANYVLPALSDRLFFIQGPRFLAGTSGLSPDSVARLRLSLEIANRPSVGAFAELRRRGISYFIVDKWAAATHAWRSFDRIAFENERFAIIDLTDD